MKKRRGRPRADSKCRRVNLVTRVHPRTQAWLKFTSKRNRVSRGVLIDRIVSWWMWKNRP